MPDRERFDAIIIGSGQSGTPLARTLAGAGWKVALVEREHVGGTCINEGCTPTKTMVASAHAAHLARRAEDYGIRVGAVHVDMPAVRRRKRDIVEQFRSGNRQSLLEAGVELLMGEGRFTGPQTVAVRLNDGGGRLLEAEKIFINTGQRPRVPKIEGLEEVAYLDSTSVMELGEVPEHLLIVGGGYVGIEFAQMFRRYGSRVTVVQRSEQVLTHEDRDVAAAVVELLEEEGIEVLLEAEAERVEAGEEDGVRLTLSLPEGERLLTGSHLLIAAGRVPNTEALDLDAAGVKTTDRGYIEANERLETGVPGIYVLGDVKGGPAFTHISYDDFRVLRTNLLEGGETSIAGRMIPYTVFMAPQLGRIGLTEKRAQKQGLDYRVARLEMSRVARAIETGETRGFMKVLVDPEDDQILGAAILGYQGGELSAMLEIAMLGNLPYTALENAIFTHPLLAESFNTLFASLEE
ncbi:MAG: mercuric reductase [Anaerolineales bacterium]